MKISINSIRVFNAKHGTSGDPAPDGADKLIARIGAQLAAIEKTIDFGKKYQGIVIAKVVTCRKHENSDHLNICMVDDGGVTPDLTRDSNGHVQVVCGAPNARAGLTVAWLPPGATVPSSVDAGEPFVLSVRDIRGETSNGMLASPKELALGDNHAGILEIDTESEGDITPGTSFAEYYNLAGDTVIDMENKMFTHRPDLFGTLGVARELAGIQGQKFTSPEWYASNADIPEPDAANLSGGELQVTVRNEIPELSPRFVALPMSGITIKPSPIWLQVELVRSGVRPINNIVDLTNYYMLLTGQPLHAYDYDKVVAQDAGDAGDAGQAAGATIVVRKTRPGEKLRLLNGKTIEPREDAILIASATKAIGLAGVMGGGETEVDANTKNIILECASFDMYSIRRTSMAHGLFSDAVTRFNKGQSPLQNLAVLAKIVEAIQTIAGGSVAGQLVDDNNLPSEARERDSLYAPVMVSQQFINERLGLNLSADQMVELLCNVEFAVGVMDDDQGATQLTVRAPFWRTDIEIPEDVVEEVGRLYGFDKLPLDLPRRSSAPATKNPQFSQKQWLRQVLSRAGANEVLTYSFVDGNLLDKVGQSRDVAFKLSNAISPELQFYRTSVTPSLLEKVHANIKAGYDAFALFEMGKAHVTSQLDDEGLPREFNRLALVFAADDRKAKASYQGAAFYQARKYAEVLFGGTLPFRLVPLHEVDPNDYAGHDGLAQLLVPFDPLRSVALYNDVLPVPIGVIGEYTRKAAKALKLPTFTAGFEIFMSALDESARTNYLAQSRFPKVWQDICLRLPTTVSYQQLETVVRQQLETDKPMASVWMLEPVDIYQRQGDVDYKQITFRLTISSYDRTLTDAEISQLLAGVAKRTAQEFGAEQV